ncbi:cytochrome P450 [Schizophyllum fasciatum]
MNAVKSALGDLPAAQDVYKLVGACAVAALTLAYLRSRGSSPTEEIPGPPRPPLRNWLLGHFSDLIADETTRIMTTDLRALHHLVTRDDVYYKPEEVRFALTRILGDGVLVTEGEKHRQQNPAFGSAQIRELTPVFLSLAEKLRDRWTRTLVSEGGEARLNALSELSLMTLDVIGKAGFDYDLSALDGVSESNELSRAFAALFGAPQEGGSFMQRAGRVYHELQAFVPALRCIPFPGPSPFRGARETMGRIGGRLLREAKAGAGVGDGGSGGSGGGGKGSAKDLLSLLVRANLAESAKGRMSDADVLAQVPTFLVAGHETTAAGTTWAIHRLALDAGIQAHLRAELRAVGEPVPGLDALNGLPYLDAFVKEVLRFYAPVPWSARVAVHDDAVPLARPYTDTEGRVHSEIRVTKGQQFIIPIHSVHRDKEIWGEDADEFKPDRWTSLPDSVKNVPSIWSHLFAFLGGPHACIGFRFSIAEMKAILFVLVRSFEFELAVDPQDIKVRNSVVQRPALKSEPDNQAQLPVRIRLAS